MVDMHREEMAIRWRTSIASGVVLACFAVGFAVLPQFFTFPTQLPARLALAAQASAFVLVWVLIGVGMVSTGRRYSKDDIAGQAYGAPSEKIAVKVAFLQNTLEQAVLTSGAMLAFASLVQGGALALIPVTVLLFAIGRILFYRGYPQGAGGRAFGMALTLIPGALLLLYSLCATLWNVFMGQPL